MPQAYIESVFQSQARNLERMNLAIRGFDANLGPSNADSFRADLHPDLMADFILAIRMRDLLLPRPLSGQVELNSN